jgi:hypothetical protein
MRTMGTPGPPSVDTTSGMEYRGNDQLVRTRPSDGVRQNPVEGKTCSVEESGKNTENEQGEEQVEPMQIESAAETLPFFVVNSLLCADSDCPSIPMCRESWWVAPLYLRRGHPLAPPTSLRHRQIRTAALAACTAAG